METNHLRDEHLNKPEKKSVGQVVKSFDIFRKLPQDMTSGTQSGALISIVSGFLLLVLFFNEIYEFQNQSVKSEMYILGKSVEEPVHSIKLAIINLDIYFPRLPCSLVSLDVQDEMGNHQLNVKDNLKKVKTDKNGKPFYLQGSIPTESDAVWAEVEAENGCHLKGDFNIKKVPGNFHISSHAHMNIVQELFLKHGTEFYSLSHTILHLSFGSQYYLNQIKSDFPNSKIQNSLDRIVHHEKLFDKTREHEVFNYYIVPTDYYTFFRKMEHYQFTANHHQIQTSQFPAIYFRHEFSPVAVKYQKNQYDQIQHFLTSICAIIGGIFTIAGVLDRVLYMFVGYIVNKKQDLTRI